MNLVLGVTGATGSLAADRLIRKSPWPVTLVFSQWGARVYARETGAPINHLAARADAVFDDSDLAAPIASGSVATEGMVILPCSVSTIGHVAAGLGDTLIHRAAHCHLKERRKTVFCLRETPLTSIDLDNCKRLSDAGGIIMPLSPPFYMLEQGDPSTVSLEAVLDSYVDRVLAILGHHPDRTWEDVR